MWRTGGRGELYPNFNADKQVSSYCSTPPSSKCQTGVPGTGSSSGTLIGDSLGTGSFTFGTGRWNTVCQRVTLNTNGRQNGRIQLSFNGIEAINIPQLYVVDPNGARFAGITIHTFFGGHDPSRWAPSSRQTAYFKNIMASVVG